MRQIRLVWKTSSLFGHLARWIAALLLATSAACADESTPLPAQQRKAMLTGFEKTVAECTAELAENPTRVSLYSQRGDAHLFLGRFAEAVTDFERMIALDPSQDAGHWRLGIAYYFANRFRESARQFEKYHTYDGRDRENGIWKCLADAKLHGIEKARSQMLEYSRFDREPFPALYEMFAGRKTADELFAELEAKKLGNDLLVQFFAHYYVGVNEDLLGRSDSAQEHLTKAVKLFADRNLPGGPGYMWQVATLHHESIAKRATAPSSK